MFKTSTTLLLCVSAALALSAFKPQNKDVSVYRLPKAVPIQEQADVQMASHHTAPALVWDLPEGWAEDETPGMMQLMSVTLPSDTKVSIVELPGKAGGIIANVNRWRGQVGLEPQAQGDIMKEVFTVDGQGGTMNTIEITGDDRAIIVSLLETPGRTAFIKIIGTKDVVAKNKDSFMAFSKSVHYEKQGE